MTVVVSDVGARQARFERLVSEVYEPIQRYSLRRTDPETAADVVSDALLVMWRRLEEVPQGGELPWSYGVVRRCLANARRGDQRRQRLATRLADAGQVPVAGPAADGAADGDPALDAAMGLLPTDDRELLRLWAWEDLGPAEIAVVLGITSNAASIRLHRAKARLRKLLTAADRGDELASRRTSRKIRRRAGQERAGHAEEGM